MYDHEQEWLVDRLSQRPLTPAGEYDGVAIKINTVPAGKKHCIVSLRNAIFTGQRPLEMSFDSDVDIRHLSYEGGEWMADTPQEIWQMYHPLESIHSSDKVLVGGLGLGVFSHLVAEYVGADVTTVEKDQRILSAVGPWISGITVHDDIYQFADKVREGEFDLAFLDTWQSTGEHCWMTEVVPLRRKLGDKIPTIMCWQEDEMGGQIRLGALHQLAVPDHRQVPSNLHYRVLRRVADKLGITTNKRLPRDSVKSMNAIMAVSAEISGIPETNDLIDRFLDNPGSPDWEEEFGGHWDELEVDYRKYRDRVKKRFARLDV